MDEAKIPHYKYLNSIIKETMRLYPIGALQVPREDTKTYVINGYVVPAKTKIGMNNWAIGRDPT